MPFYEQRVGLCLEFSMTSFWSCAPCSQDSGDGVGLHQTGRLDRIVTVEEEERDAEAGRQRELHRLTKCPAVCANFYGSALPGIYLLIISAELRSMLRVMLPLSVMLKQTCHAGG